MWKHRSKKYHKLPHFHQKAPKGSQTRQKNAHIGIRDQESAGSSPVTPTISSVHKRFQLWTLDFSILIRLYVRSRRRCLLFFRAVLRRFRIGEMFHGDALAGIGFVICFRRRVRQFDIAPAKRQQMTIRWVRSLPVPSVSNTSMWSMSFRSSGAVRYSICISTARQG